MALISLIARRPKQIQDIDDIVEAIKVLATDDDEAAKNQLKISIDQIKYYIAAYGEKMDDSEIEKIISDCDHLVNDGDILIDDFANYLM